jgi:hypothetical protein
MSPKPVPMPRYQCVAAKSSFEKKERTAGRIRLRWILRKEVMGVEGGSNWLRIVSNRSFVEEIMGKPKDTFKKDLR